MSTLKCDSPTTRLLRILSVRWTTVQPPDSFERDSSRIRVSLRIDERKPQNNDVVVELERENSKLKFSFDASSSSHSTIISPAIRLLNFNDPVYEPEPDFETIVATVVK